jgi:hypothetical protein
VPKRKHIKLFGNISKGTSMKFRSQYGQSEKKLGEGKKKEKENKTN